MANSRYISQFNQTKNKYEIRRKLLVRCTKKRDQDMNLENLLSLYGSIYNLYYT